MRKRGKKGISEIIILLILIVLILLLIVVIWIIIKGVIQKQSELAEIKSVLFSEKIDIGDVDIGNYHINLTIKKGPGKEILINETIIKRQVYADVVSVVDLSGTMQTNVNCRMNFSSECCQNNNNCANSPDCETCNGLWENENCTFINPQSPCCFSEGFYKCNSNPITCMSCNGIISSKLNEVKIANKEFIAQILSVGGNNVGLVGYGDNASEKHSHELSDDLISLNLVIDDWITIGGTCICCGINRAIDMLKDSKHLKAMVIMTDGCATETCDNPPQTYIECNVMPTQQAIESAKKAWEEHGIRVHAVGFGVIEGSLGYNFLIEIARAGNGTYYFSDVSKLSRIYLQVSEQIVREYEQLTAWNYLSVIFYNGTDSYEYRIYDPPGILESKTYTIPSEGQLTEYITNVIKIEIYPVAVSSRGERVIGPKLDTWERKPPIVF